MKISSVGKGKMIGTAAGLATGSAYMAKNGKKLLEFTKQQAKSLGENEALAKNTAIATGAIIIGTLAVAGRLAGAGIGKLIQNHNEKKLPKMEDLTQDFDSISKN